MVEPDAVLENTVILAGATIRSGAHVERAIVDAGADVPPNARVRGGSDPTEPIAVVAKDRSDGGQRPSEA